MCEKSDNINLSDIKVMKMAWKALYLAIYFVFCGKVVSQGKKIFKDEDIGGPLIAQVLGPLQYYSCCMKIVPQEEF